MPAQSLLGARAVAGRIVGCTDRGQILVVWPGQPSPLPAEALWQPVALDWAQCRGLRALLALSEGGRPFVLGLLDSPPAAAWRNEPAAAVPGDEAAGCGAPAPESPAGQPEFLKLESARELILQCGQAKIALRADGRITILGGYILTRSTGPTKIKGGSVQIN
jgi:hypothetical protein